MRIGSRAPAGLPTLQLGLIAMLAAACLSAFAGPARSAGAGEAGSSSDPPELSELTELTLEELMQVKLTSVYSASRYDQKTWDAPASVSIITSEDIRDYGYRTVADVLGSVRGLYLNYDRNYTLLGVRGFQRPGDSNSRILLLVDGQRVNENIYDSAYLGTDCPIDLGMVDRIEVIRGSGSSVYGSNALFGVVNVVTRRGRDLAGSEVSLEGGSFGTGRGRFAFGHEYAGGTMLQLGGSWLRSDGSDALYFPEFDDPATNQGLALSADRDRARSFTGSVSFGHVSIQAALNSRTKQIPTASYGTVFNDPREETTDGQGFFNVKYQRALSPTVRLDARTSYSYYDYDGTYPYSGEDSSTIVINRDNVQGRWVEFESQLTRHLADRHTVTAGVEVRRNITQNMSNYDEEPFEVFSDIHRSNWNVGGFAQAEMGMSEALALTVGMRYDRYLDLDGTLSPRVALVCRPAPRTGIKMLFGRAFRAPNVWESYFFDPVSKASPAVEPERTTNYELVLEQRFHRNMSLTACGFFDRVDGLISQVIDPVDSLIFNTNVDEVQSSGAEVELDARFDSGLRGRASYAYQYSSNKGTGVELDNSPRHLAKLNLRVPLWGEHLAAGLDVRHGGAVWTLARNRERSHWLTSLTLTSRDVIRGLEVSLTANNLFDAHYAYPGGSQHVEDTIPQDGRTINARATARF